MNQPTHYRNISIAEIEIDNTSFNLRPTPDSSADKDLTSSIRELGILHPPLLQAANGKWLILSGRKRIEAAQRLKWSTLPCLILDDEISPLLKYRVILAHALLGSQLSPVEQAFFFQQAREQLSEAEMLLLLPSWDSRPNPLS